MVRVIYYKLAPFLAPFFLLTTIVFFGMCLWRGEIILGLQAQAVKDQKQTLEVVVTHTKATNKVSQNYEDKRSEREQEKVYVDRVVDKIVLMPSYNTECFDNAGVHQLNSYITSINGSSEPSEAVSSSTGAN